MKNKKMNIWMEDELEFWQWFIGGMQIIIRKFYSGFFQSNKHIKPNLKPIVKSGFNWTVYNEWQ